MILCTISGNFLGYSQDQNPWLLGSKFVTSDADKFKSEQALEAIATVKKIDPTRGVFSHQGGWAGNVHTVNGYLNMMPLQEREEYLSNFVQNGVLPFMVIEGGLPLDMTMFRNRTGCDKVYRSEPLVSEFCAIYLGRNSYTLETNAYRKNIKERLEQSQPPDVPDPGSAVNAHGQMYKDSRSDIASAPSFQELLKLFIRNTWRSWRTSGACATMLPWSAHSMGGWDDADRNVKLSEPRPGLELAGQNIKPLGQTRGYVPSEGIEPKNFFMHHGDNAKLRPCGQELVAGSQPVMAWICGPQDGKDNFKFAAKDHSFAAGGAVTKSAALLNDSRDPQNFEATWRVMAAGRQLATKTERGTLNVSEIRFLPIRGEFPEDLTDAKADGSIELSATIGQREIKDTFAFRVFNRVKPYAGGAFLIDPAGKTTAMLKAAGIATQPWEPGAKEGLLLVGREYFNDHDALPEGTKDFVANGGRLVIFAQDPWRLRNVFNFRIAHHMPRYAFAVDPKHPVMDGLDDLDVRDWAGSSTLVPEGERKEIPYRASSSHVWKWGNRGAISSAAIEKPHHSSWRPILECEFDLAYTTLMELDYGKGRAILCTLDLEDYISSEPAAARLLSNILSYAKSARTPSKSGRTVYLGGGDGAKLLDSMGLAYEKITDLPAEAQLSAAGADSTSPELLIAFRLKNVALAIVGADAKVDLTQFIQNGGKALYLARKADAPFGAALKEEKAFHGSSEIPAWPECAGLSPSDLRFKVDLPWPLVAAGAEIGANGLLGRIQKGSGTALLCQLDPAALNANEQTYNRYTRWRQTRAIAQLLANLGATFANDERLFTPRRDEIYLAGLWDAKVTITAPFPVRKWADHEKIWSEKETSEAMNAKPACVDAPFCKDPAAPTPEGWTKAQIPGGFEWMLPKDAKSMAGVAVFRRVVTIPPEMAGRELFVNFDLCMERVNMACWDGTPFTRAKSMNWAFPQNEYRLTPEMATAGAHVLSVALANGWVESHLGSNPYEMRIVPQSSSTPGWYHADYRRDPAYGDDPYRYVRW